MKAEDRKEAKPEQKPEPKSSKWWLLVAASFVLGRGLMKRRLEVPKGVVPRANNQTGHVHKV